MYQQQALKNRHLQTLLRTFMVKKPSKFSRQRLELDDGDFIDCDWFLCENPRRILISYQTTGHTKTHYVQNAVGMAQKHNTFVWS